ncbi:PfkB family carbohydrate kinase [Prochlorococcus sp. MIT 1341]|uniref:PfkB family carbohydrate kinase n=1 Tax=Prochlorococcus sp. MIT 1341 TaxID=3096221 RepID=UPI002A756B6C|nr:PfkB family carbohydrate kinase [Prochlorococcus sp. MIT 1341]
MKRWDFKDLPRLPKLKLAVIGHVEWVTFVAVNKLPQAGIINHAKNFLEEPAGGGAVVAAQLVSLNQGHVDFFTALGKDSLGEIAIKRLTGLGLNVHVSWKKEPTRRAISMIDQAGERAITVIGKRLQPLGRDNLPWEMLKNYDGIFVTATDSEGLKKSRNANLLAVTPRTGLQTIREANIQIDALIGSGKDPDEKIARNILSPEPKLHISTEGASGGEVWPLGRYEAFPLKNNVVNAYGCGDSFAAGVTAGLAANWNIEKAISLGAYCGSKCASTFGPY